MFKVNNKNTGITSAGVLFSKVAGNVFYSLFLIKLQGKACNFIKKRL